MKISTKTPPQRQETKEQIKQKTEEQAKPKSKEEQKRVAKLQRLMSFFNKAGNGNFQMVNTLTGTTYNYVANEFRKAPRKPLDDTELQILYLLAKGYQSTQIMHQLGFSKENFGVKKKSAFAKLGAATQTEAVVKALDLGFIKLR